MKTENKILSLCLSLALLGAVSVGSFLFLKNGSKKLVGYFEPEVFLYSDRNITRNAIRKDTRFEGITFAEPTQRRFSYKNQVASVVRSVRSFFVAKEKGSYTEKGTWVWTPTLLMTDQYIESLLSDLKNQGINVVYLSIDSYLDIFSMVGGKEKEAKEKEFEAKIDKFVTKASRRGIKVDAEAGWRNWAESGHSYKPLAILEFVVGFNSNHSNKFRGFQYDIEPYLLEEYKKDNDGKKTVLQNFIKLVDQTAGFISKNDLNFGVVIPDFYDKKDRMTPMFFYNGKKDSAFGHLLKILDQKEGGSIVVMSYRNFAEGKNGSIEASKNEIKTAKRKGYSTKIIIAQEVSDVLPPFITFHNTSRKRFDAESSKLTSAFKLEYSFGGIAIHYANAFLALK